MKDFYDKENNPEYYKKYEQEHSARINFTIEHFKMQFWSNKSIIDIGCSSGFFLNKLSHPNDLWGVDESIICQDLKRKFRFVKMNLNNRLDNDIHHVFIGNYFDIVTCFETLEHIPNLYNCVSEIKRIAKIDADIYLSIPHKSVTHNTLYPALFYPETHFEQFLAQMALPIREKVYCPESFPTWIYHCKNAPWQEKQLMFPKLDERFIDASPLEVINT